MTLTPTLLLILDGFGLAPAGPGNAIARSADREKAEGRRQKAEGRRQNLDAC